MMWRLSILLLCLLAAIGCGNSKGTVGVSGKVTLGGEAMPGGGTITFTVVEPADGFPHRPAMARFGPDGKYSATTYDEGDGLVPGSYQVAVECYETPPNMEGKPTKSYIDAKYSNGETSGFELEVKPKSRPMKFDIALE